MNAVKRISLLVPLFMIFMPGISSAQDQYRSGFDPYVVITLSQDLSVSTQVVTEIHANVPFYIGIQLPPLLARHKDFSTDYTIDLTVFRPDGKILLQKDEYFSPQLVYLSVQAVTHGGFAIHATPHKKVFDILFHIAYRSDYWKRLIINPFTSKK